MCVIIARKPNVLIPEDKLRSAAIVNPDGFGFSVIDRGQIETVKLWEPGGNKAADIIKAFEDCKDHQVYMHLRYTTAGKTNVENCHPFQSFKGDGYEVQFMHNGTLSSFKKDSSDFSDTYHFNEEIIKPTLKAFYELYGNGVLMDPTFKRILSEFKSGGSIFTLYDSNGNELILGTGKQYDGWWASNDYSFNRSHREPTVDYTHRRKYSQGYYDNYKDVFGDSCAVDSLPKSSTPTQAIVSSHFTTPLTTSSQKALGAEAAKVGHAIKYLKALGGKTVELTPPENRITFRELASIGSLHDVCVLSEEELYDLVTEQPLAATALLMDLIHELWSNKRAEKAATVTPLRNAGALANH